MENKKRYNKPELVIFGNVEKVTHGGSAGDFTDATFPVDTPKSQLTFSP